ncbi:hypothetical protein C8Q69DRAFT_502945 [Paecilomyces variotii]|uniref:Basic proline-rich protein n=1 Tax=Byssochlamys spectabilis TaxID=264951 RepID=A0A443I5S0_BYSSP|nr:hypothetical protein C8Q69DRAFT_502945 [Paecilomyces variotii]KAJ9286641.1 hypothetical protein DTO021C3_5795 [Paecilomyces variotii]KAJ9307538.1 hypothetical protein DTO217A2_3010 [Paecilomyces variotii]KAJ9357199.1 hypothetical protein DTO280E4_5764 [Paecilomyces variotii]RWQ99414.1 hypothetical protein C8Q69DRAFT_502945 [Paecilomyces variotii]
MDASCLLPEQIPLPPSPTEPAGHSNDVATEVKQHPQKLEDVTINSSLSLPIQQPLRDRSPFSRTHFRSRSLAGPPGAPMTRAHSTPGPDSRGRYIFITSPAKPPSPLDLSKRRHSPLRMNFEESGYPSMASLNVSETISEHAELDSRSRSSGSDLDTQANSPTFLTTMHHTFPRAARRRPSSPLFPPAINTSGPYTSSPVPTQSSPVTLGAKYNEAFPSYSTSSGSSVPSTPTSIRSRSPSISSLETIPDIPDAEAAATEADRIDSLKAANDRADTTADTTRLRGWPDTSGSSNGVGNMRTGLGGYGVRTDKRKRWSVCGAERRQDLDLETIWED